MVGRPVRRNHRAGRGAAARCSTEANEIMVRRVVIAVLLLLGAGMAFTGYAGSKLTEPATRSIGAPPAALDAGTVVIPSASGSLIHGWLSRSSPGSGAVLLLHGVRANRTDMIPRALFLHRLGYSVLLIDLQAHGESPGRWITFGDLESRDVTAAVEYLRATFPRERVGIVGVSLGAAATVLAEKPLHASAIVLESMYPTIQQAVVDRLTLHLGAWGAYLARPLIAAVAWRTDVNPQRLRPIDRIGTLGAPLLMIHGTLDQHTPVDEAQSLFAAAAEPKTLWLVEGAAHVDLHRYTKEEYERRVSEFLRENLSLEIALSRGDETKTRQLIRGSAMEIAMINRPRRSVVSRLA